MRTRGSRRKFSKVLSLSLSPKPYTLNPVSLCLSLSLCLSTIHSEYYILCYIDTHTHTHTHTHKHTHTHTHTPEQAYILKSTLYSGFTQEIFSGTDL